jgi:hypothetical protein
MNRTRILSLIAVSVAGVVGVGMMFQQEAELAELPAPAVSDAPVQVASASLLPGVPRETAPVSGATDDQGRQARLDPTDAVRPFQTDSAEPDPRSQPLAGPLTGPLSGPFTAAGGPDALNDGVVGRLAGDVAPSCDVWIVATPDVGALVELSLFAPCHSGQTARVQHGPLAFDVIVGADGQLLTNVPAMEREGVYAVTLPDGVRAEDTATVQDFSLYDRVAIAWTGADVLGLNIYEFGAEHGAAGHLHPGNAHASDLNAQGFMILLGDEAEGARAQVYSYPSGVPIRGGSIRIEIEAKVTEDSCGRVLAAESFETYGGSDVDRHDLTVHMPACSDTGGFLVLKNFLPDLTIAMN